VLHFSQWILLNQKPSKLHHGTDGSTSQTIAKSFGDFSIMPTKESLITYQASQFPPRLDRLVAKFGDRLEKLTAIDKLDLIAIFGFWQSADTEHSQNELPPIGLSEYLGLNHELQIGTSRQLDEALEILDGCSDSDALTLLVSLVHQLRDGAYAE
jgi:hypothetical protein